MLTFVTEAANIVFLGPPGVDKAHLAVALGLRAIEQGFGVYFSPQPLERRGSSPFDAHTASVLCGGPLDGPHLRLADGPLGPRRNVGERPR
jgi:hypothetical protein